jgi:hypothetical protein
VDVPPFTSKTPKEKKKRAIESVLAKGVREGSVPEENKKLRHSNAPTF